MATKVKKAISQFTGFEENEWHAIHSINNRIEFAVQRRIRNNKIFAENVVVHAKNQLLSTVLIRQNNDKKFDSNSFRVSYFVENAIRKESRRNHVSLTPVSHPLAAANPSSNSSRLNELFSNQVEFEIKALRWLGKTNCDIGQFCGVSANTISRMANFHATPKPIVHRQIQILLATVLCSEIGVSGFEFTSASGETNSIDRLMDAVEIRKSKIDGLGVFAKTKFAKGDFIGPIFGELHEDSNYDSVTCFEVDEKRGTKLEPASPFCYLNHACIPNSKAYIVDTSSLALFAKSEILPGDEIVIDYEWPKEYDQPCKCHMLFSSCTGHISK